MAIGGGIGTVIVVLLLSQFLGVDLSQFLGAGETSRSAGSVDGTSLAEKCRTGEDANRDVECRMVGAANSLESYWETELPELGTTYRSPSMELFVGQTVTGCGTATSDVGPFYCSADESVYLDVGFFDVLTDQLGADEGNLSQMYVVAHEWGHHIQNVTGIMTAIDRRSVGATSDSVRLELQADCLAGAWAGAASTTADESGQTFLKPFTDAELANALSAAAAVGDDRIQAQQGRVSPETWTHGSADQRQHWFLEGVQGGPPACDTFDTAAGSL